MSGTWTPDWDAARMNTVRHLQSLIRLDTTNPPGDEEAAASYIAGALRDEGIDAERIEPFPRRTSIAARLRGSGRHRAVLLLAHTDVVGVEREHWTIDPFGGEIRGDHLYGRGAIDDKGMLAVNLVALLLLKREIAARGVTPSRDVIFIAAADEEAGSAAGLAWIAENRQDLLDAEFAVNEGGRIRVVNGRPLYAAIQCAEKIPYTVRVTARGTSGHAAVPLADNAVFRLGRALAAIGVHSEPTELSDTSRAFFTGLAHVWPDEGQSSAMADLGSGDSARAARGASAITAIPTLDAVLRHGISATMVSGGVRSNVIPAEASATLNIRLLPNGRIEQVISRMKRAVGDERVSFDITGEPAAIPPESPTDSAMYRALAESLRDAIPGIAIVPYLGAGATDNATLRARGVQAYGLLPFPLDQNDEERMHGHDERVPLESLATGLRVIHGALRRIALREEDQ